MSPESGVVHAGDDVEQCGLPGAVGSDHGHDLTFVEGEIDALNHIETAEGLLQLGDLENRRHVISTLLVPSSPWGRTAIMTISSAPNRSWRVMLG